MLKQMQERRGSDEGFTLIELLIAIVVIGVLSAVVIVGIGGLTNNGKTAACKTGADAARAATAVHYANTSGTYPDSLDDMTGLTKELVLPEGAAALAANTMSYTINGWTLTMTAGSPPTYACS
jgi:prepilin-type N-terminal cleavage/methylation domain-containing protein